MEPTYTKSDQDSDYSRQILTAREYISHRFECCNFSQANLGGSKFSECRFVECNFTNTRLDGCSFHEVRFESCKILGVSFSLINTLILDIGFEACFFKFCSFSDMDLVSTCFAGSEIIDCQFVDTNLSKCDFSGCDLAKSVFENTDLTKANFKNAVNYCLDPTRNKLKKARFSQPDVLGLLKSFDVLIE